MATRRIDLIAAGILACLGGGGLAFARTFPPRAAMWPTAVMAALLVAALVMLVLSLRRGPETSTAPAAEREDAK